MFGTMDDWIQRQKQQQHSEVRLVSGYYKPPPMEEEEDLESPIVEDDAIPQTVDDAPQQRVKMWPPWPFNLLQRRRDWTTSSSSSSLKLVRQGPVASTGALLWTFFGKRARLSVKEMQEIGSRLWFHLPPMTPPLLLMCLIPRQESQVAILEGGVETVLTRTVVPLWSNPLARTLVLTGFSLACMSWAHSELNQLRKLTPLPLNDAYRDIHTAVLPHVLPDEVAEPFIVEDDYDDDDEEEHVTTPDKTTTKSSSISQKLAASVPPRLQRHFKQFGNTEAPSSWRKNMKRMREARRSEAQKVRRMAIYDELVALQAIKRKAAVGQQQPVVRKRRTKAKGEVEPLGYALVTGASRGIGRAIAVELARWEVPLILVARDLPRLTSLAYDLEACYGIQCCVVQADLSQPHAAERIHRATREAGLAVDILVNNAGISSTGLAVDMPLKDVDRMIRVNAVAVAHLAHLYGRDMKERRRGRILMVSSVTGAVTAGPTVAVYAATKAFEKTLGLSLAKELEPYGVGVTCLMPGAVRDTDFRTASSTYEALCWKLPGYPRAPARVASMGIQALLTGSAEVTPGWQNRVFLKVLQPAMPQRLHNILVEIAWNPPMVPPFLKIWKTPESRQSERQKQLEELHRNPASWREEKSFTRRKPSPQEWRPRMNLPPPLFLTIPGEESASAATGREAEPEDTNPSLVGPDPEPIVPEYVNQSNNTSEAVTTSESDSPNDSPADYYEELKKLPGSVSADPKSFSEGLESAPPSSAETDLGSQQQRSELQLLQLQTQVLKLQQRLEKQEQQQVQRQGKLERHQQELEYEKGDSEKNVQEGLQTNKLPRWNRPTTSSSVPKSQAERPGVGEVLPIPKVSKTMEHPTLEEGRKRDLMSESLEHPLMSQ